MVKAAAGAKTAAQLIKLSVTAPQPGGSEAAPAAVPTPGEQGGQQGGSGCGASAQPAGSTPSAGASTPGASSSQPPPQAQVSEGGDSQSQSRPPGRKRQRNGGGTTQPRAKKRDGFLVAAEKFRARAEQDQQIRAILQEKERAAAAGEFVPEFSFVEPLPLKPRARRSAPARSRLAGAWPRPRAGARVGAGGWGDSPESEAALAEEEEEEEEEQDLELQFRSDARPGEQPPGATPLPWGSPQGSEALALFCGGETMQQQLMLALGGGSGGGLALSPLSMACMLPSLPDADLAALLTREAEGLAAQRAQQAQHAQQLHSPATAAAHAQAVGITDPVATAHALGIETIWLERAREALRSTSQLMPAGYVPSLPPPPPPPGRALRVAPEPRGASSASAPFRLSVKPLAGGVRKPPQQQQQQQQQPEGEAGGRRYSFRAGRGRNRKTEDIYFSLGSDSEEEEGERYTSEGAGRSHASAGAAPGSARKAAAAAAQQLSNGGGAALPPPPAADATVAVAVQRRGPGRPRKHPLPPPAADDLARADLAPLAAPVPGMISLAALHPEQQAQRAQRGGQESEERELMLCLLQATPAAAGLLAAQGMSPLLSPFSLYLRDQSGSADGEPRAAPGTRGGSAPPNAARSPGGSPGPGSPGVLPPHGGGRPAAGGSGEGSGEGDDDEDPDPLNFDLEELKLADALLGGGGGGEAPGSPAFADAIAAILEDARLRGGGACPRGSTPWAACLPASSGAVAKPAPQPEELCGGAHRP